MAVESRSWEQSLLSLAHEAWQTSHIHPSTPARSPHEIAQAYEYCEALTSIHSRSFYMASRLLPLEKRRAARALYAFCRVTDDIVDEQSQHRDRLSIRASLEQWRQRALAPITTSEEPVVIAWTDARARYRIPQSYAEQLIDGVSQDLHTNRYRSFNQLSAYCYGVASTVGLMSMHIIGFEGPEAIPYAVKLGVALQMTNILRDIKEDWDNGRLYLPTEELEAFGLSGEDIEAGRNTPRWRRFMRFQIERNRQLYEEAWPGIAMLNEDGRFSIAAAAELYQGILDDIELHNYDVFSRRAYVSKWGKLRRLPGIWWRSRNVQLAQ